MRSIDRFALSFAPLLLRLAIGLTFLWTGAGKIFHYVELGPEQTATLARIEAGTASSNTVLPPQGEAIDEPLPDPEEADTEGEIDPEDVPEEDTERPRLRSLTDPSAAAPVQPGYSLVLAQDGEIDAALDEAAADAAEHVGENPSKRRFLVYVALTINSAAHPEQGSALVPGFVSNNAMKFAWAVAIIEFVGGACLLLGFMTRLWTIAITGVMGGVVWITEIGPAMMGGLDQTFLGFLPPIWPFNLDAGVHFFWTVGLLLSVFALFLLGAGTLSVDRVLFGNPNKRDDGVAPDDVV